jgi:hypothetical protein
MQKNTRKEWPFLPDMKSISFNKTETFCCLVVHSWGIK